MTSLTFYPIGNADCTAIELEDDRIILKDFSNFKDSDDERVDLEEELRTYLRRRDRNSFDYVIFSHSHDDHVHGAENFFWLEHADKYQDDSRVKIEELWVPANFILEEGAKGSARVLRQEARHRFKKGKGIRVFGNPEPLNAWLQSQGLNPNKYIHLIAQAGQCLPGFDQNRGAVEIFAHSPFSFRMEEELDDRNGHSIVLHFTFFEDDLKLRCLLGADAEHSTWSDIVYITRKNNNDARLEWDLFRISHHCSYTAIGPEKGIDETVPTEETEYLFDQGGDESILIASCKPIPEQDEVQPPHRQAAKFYRRIADENGDESNFLITMEWPTSEDPKPIVVKTTSNGFLISQGISSLLGVTSVVSNPSPRFGEIRE